MNEFSLLIKPSSADCNLRCRYCFYLDRSTLYPQTTNHRMNDATLEAMIASYQALPLRRFLYGWQGGEPTLMGSGFFRRAVEFQRRYAPAGAVIANTLQTNATLIDEEMAVFFREEKFLLGVSLDGPALMHDGYRQTAGGAATHAMALRGIGMLRRAGVEFNILTLVNDRNGRDGGALYRHLRDEGYRYLQFIPCVALNGDGRPAEYSVGSGQWGEFLCGVYDAWRAHDTQRVSVRLFDTLLQYLLTGVRNCCEMNEDCRQYLLVEHNGDVYPCDFHVAPEWLLGNLHNVTWPQMLDSPRYEAFGRRKREWCGRCRACPYLAFCAGGCPKNRTAAEAEDYLCKGLQIFYAHALPGLRRLAATLRRAQDLPASSAPLRGLPSPNAPCPCGSGKKCKCCCGSGRR